MFVYVDERNILSVATCSLVVPSGFLPVGSPAGVGLRRTPGPFERVPATFGEKTCDANIDNTQKLNKARSFGKVPFRGSMELETSGFCV